MYQARVIIEARKEGVDYILMVLTSLDLEKPNQVNDGPKNYKFFFRLPAAAAGFRA